MQNDLKLASGQVISGNDPNWDTYKSQGATEIVPQTTPPDAQNGATSPVATPTGQTTQVAQTTPNLSQRVADTPANLTANKNFVNAVFKSAKGRDATAEELAQYTGKTVGDIRNAVMGTTKSSGITTVDDMSKGKLTVPNYNTMTSDPDTFMAGITTLYDKLNQPTEKLLGLQKTQDTFENKYIELLTKLSGRKQEELNLYEKYEIEQKAEAVKEIDSKIGVKIAEYNAINERVKTAPISQTQINAQVNYNKRVMAADIAVLNAQKSVLLDKYNMAKDYINKALELEFGGLQDQITATAEFLKLNKDKLDAEQSKIAKKNEFILNAVSSLLEEQKAEKESLYKLQLALIENGKDPSLVDMNKSYEENLLAVGNQLQSVKRTVGGGGRTSTTNPGDYTDQEIRKLRAAGIDPTDVETADNYLYPQKITDEDIIKAIQLDINDGVNVGEIINTLQSQGLDPFNKKFFPFIDKAILAQIQRDIDKKMTEKEIRQELRDAGLSDDEIDEYKKEIDKAPNKFTRLFMR